MQGLNNIHKKRFETQIAQELEKIYGEQEAAAIAKIYIQDKDFGQGASDEVISSAFAKDLARLLKSEPVQYIVGKAFFYKTFFEVNPHVLIPRPETEELVYIVSQLLKNELSHPLRILDVGTGSGCLGISLAQSLHTDVELTLLDISNDAMMVAKENAMKHAYPTKLIELDFLDETKWHELGDYSVVISNPPYIDEHERQEMMDNVLSYEPALALFAAPPILFYQKLLHFVQLQKGQVLLACECNPLYMAETQRLFSEFNMKDIIIHQDLQGKERHVTAWHFPQQGELLDQ